MCFQKITTKEELEALRAPSIEGYLWHSDKDSPVILQGQPFEPEKLTDLPLPFVVEGMLYNKAKQISLRIQNLDGAYVISKIDLAEAAEKAEVDTTNFRIETSEYPAFRMGSIKNLIFKEAYNLVEDSLNPGFQVWKPTWRAFVGFK